MSGSTLSLHPPDTAPKAALPPASRGLQRFAWFVLAYNVLVVLWGSVVRATGSGGGCGAHWPLCNGEVLPQLARFHTAVEFTHRLMSGAALALIAVLVYLTWRATVRRSLARVAAAASMVLVLNEALLGALLVLLQLVEGNASLGRAIYLSFHFANTLLLLGALALTAELLARPRWRSSTMWRHGKILLSGLGLAATLVVGVSGSLAALGDTLFPATTLSGALHQDFSPAAGLLLRLRWIHPASALLAGVFILWLLRAVFQQPESPRARKLATAVLVTLLLQYGLGVLDVLLLAPTWLQVVHLLGADCFWISLVLLTASVCLFPAESQGNPPE